MSPIMIFFAGLILLALFIWYFFTEQSLRKRTLGLVLTVLLVSICIEAVYPPAQKIRLGLDLQGGTSFLLRLIDEKGEGINAGMLDQAIEVIRKRVDQFGVSEPIITTQGSDSILVQIPGLDTAQLAETQEQLQRVAKLEFALVHPASESIIAQVDAGTAVLPPGYIRRELKDEVEGKEKTFPLLVKQRPDLTGEHVRTAHPFFNEQGYGVTMKLDSEGAQIFGDLTSANVGQRLAILLDGEIQSAPNIRQPIFGGEAVITGRFSDKEARNLASVLENPLRTPVQIEEVRSVSSTLGADSVRSGFTAFALGMILTVGFMIFYYRLAGVVASIALILNIVILLGGMSMFGFVLTLPGIAGIVLTIGMAVDANVLIFERIREELRAGKSLATSIHGGYDKAFSAIFDANLTTLITSVILFWQATGPVKGFAVTLTIGIMASMFTALLVTHVIFGWMLESFGLKRIHMMSWFPSKTIDFLRHRYVILSIAGLAFLGSIGVFVLRGERNLGIDFTGGDLLVLSMKEAVPMEKVRAALGTIGMADVEIQRSSDQGVELLSIQSRYDTADSILAQLKKDVPDADWTVKQNDTVGPRVGRELAGRSAIALLLGMVGIFAYVMFRFEFSFALGALVGLVHDVVVTVGIFLALGHEFSLVFVGAVLTIAGYSINDTIVVFDRVREGLRSGRRGSLAEITNLCINETLSRTILTGGTTLLATFALFIAGGPVLSDFALAILIGVVLGTLSSIVIAPPIAIWWSERSGQSLKREVMTSSQSRGA